MLSDNAGSREYKSRCVILPVYQANSIINSMDICTIHAINNCYKINSISYYLIVIGDIKKINNSGINY